MINQFVETVIIGKEIKVDDVPESTHLLPLS